MSFNNALLERIRRASFDKQAAKHIALCIEEYEQHRSHQKPVALLETGLIEANGQVHCLDNDRCLDGGDNRTNEGNPDRRPLLFFRFSASPADEPVKDTESKKHKQR